MNLVNSGHTNLTQAAYNACMYNAARGDTVTDGRPPGAVGSAEMPIVIPDSVDAVEGGQPDPVVAMV